MRRCLNYEKSVCILIGECIKPCSYCENDERSCPNFLGFPNICLLGMGDKPKDQWNKRKELKNDL